jgi:competence protein ComEA
MSPEHPTSTESRAAAVLDSLVRERPPARRRSWQLRQLAGTPQEPTVEAGTTLPGALADPGASGSVLSLVRRHRAAVIAVAIAVVVLASLVLARRPPPIDERLPMTAAGEASPAVTSSGDVDEGQPSEPAASSGSAEGTASGEVVVHVAGAVAAPGVVRLAASGRIVDAVAAAGGLRHDADPDRVNLAAPVSDGQRIVIPVRGEPVPDEVVTARPEGTPSDGTAGSVGPAGASSTAVDLNTATAEQLDTLPGVGPATAAAILAHREEHGPFRSVDDLIEVRGIGEAKLEALRDLVAVSGAG